MSTLPSLSFGALFDKSWAGVKNNLPLIAALSFVYVIALAALYRIPFLGHFITGMLSPGYLVCLMKLKDKKDITVQDFFWAFSDMNRFLQLVILNICVGFLIVAGFICLIIPGIYVSVAIGFSSTYFVIRNQDAIEAIKASFRIVNGRWWQVLFLFIMIGFLNLAGVICLGIGVLLTIPMSVLIMVYALEEMDVVSPQTGSGAPTNPEVLG